MQKQAKMYEYLTRCVMILRLSAFLTILVNYSGIENMQTKPILPLSEELPALSPEFKSQPIKTIVLAFSAPIEGIENVSNFIRKLLIPSTPLNQVLYRSCTDSPTVQGVLRDA